MIPPPPPPPKLRGKILMEVNVEGESLGMMLYLQETFFFLSGAVLMYGNYCKHDCCRIIG